MSSTPPSPQRPSAVREDTAEAHAARATHDSSGGAASWRDPVPPGPRSRHCTVDASPHWRRPLRRRIRTASFVHELLSRRYGVKSIVDKMCWELYQTIQKLRMEDKELDIFGAASPNPNPTALCRA